MKDFSMPSNALSVVDLVSASLSTHSLQHQVIASNIANRDTQGYQRIKFEFDRAMRTGRVAADDSTDNVPMEPDLVALSSNSAQYQAMARVLSRYFSIAAAIAGSGRG
jgi:flagellar basal body rod protein FlgB